MAHDINYFECEIPQLLSEETVNEKPEGRNRTRFRPCPNCGQTISSNGHNFIHHLRKCDSAMARQMFPREYKMLEDNMQRLALKKLNSMGATTPEVLNPGTTFAAYVKVDSAHANGHLITVIAPDGSQFEGFIIGSCPVGKTQGKTQGKAHNEEYMFGQ